jgi:hypothetical protein
MLCGIVEATKLPAKVRRVPLKDSGSNEVKPCCGPIATLFRMKISDCGGLPVVY